MNDMEKKPKMRKSGLKPGVQVIMHSCYVAWNEKYMNKVWKVEGSPLPYKERTNIQYV
jgi:hypothetical protein